MREVRRLVADRLRGTAGHALVLTGVRRCGKSTLQRQLRRRMSGVGVFCNLEDTRLYGMGPEDFATVLSVLDEHYPRAAVYLDEVQEVPEWQRLVRALLDAGRRVCVTGSNASLLGRDLGAKLTGRHLSSEVYPFSYGEYLELRDGERCAASLESYLREGGFPGALLDPGVAPDLLRELLRDVVQRDIVSRHALRETRHLMNLGLHLLAHTGQPLSLQALAKGLAIPSVAQVARYVEYLQDAWLLLAVPRFSASFRRRVISPPKYYAIDPGFCAANTPNPTPDLGRRLENAILLALRRRGEAPTYAAEAHLWECDFVTPELAIQVCAQLTPANRAREMRGLIAAASIPGRGARRRTLLLLTLDQRDAIKEDGYDVAVTPAWEWLD
ncbi:MAG: ATP-binding protein [Acidobacteria bacterium]|nr:ATP-binding protein [Acidobacteriota bacterium]